ncbi:hypothetical protein BDM02DRAFT_2716809 [Thelephora ganbajun]|uniref:Uncharacterized protein n=1 Tax=Thelephora ganbajun TaxID=370292 RepID=A0ACB6ZCQ7_THEGA|nr:hypothetical protein BDM02DRAFT_2716809 [Thelephora ganbajun]
MECLHHAHVTPPQSHLPNHLNRAGWTQVWGPRFKHHSILDPWRVEKGSGHPDPSEIHPAQEMNPETRCGMEISSLELTGNVSPPPTPSHPDSLPGLLHAAYPTRSPALHTHPSPSPTSTSKSKVPPSTKILRLASAAAFSCAAGCVTRV